MKLHKLHVLHRQAGAHDHRAAIARAGMCRRAGEVGASVAAGRQDDLVGAEAMQSARGQVYGNDTAASAVLHDQVDSEVFDKKLGIVCQRLLIERMQHCVTRAIGRCAGALCRALTIMRGHATKRALVNSTFLGTRERHTVMLEFDDGIGRLLAHVLNRILVTEPVGALDRVVHVPTPVILPHVAKRGANAALRCHGVTACWEYFRDAGGPEAGFCQSECRTQPGAAGADH